MTIVEKFQTAGINPGQRLAYWNDIVGNTYTGTFVDAPSPDFQAEMWRWSVGDLAMIRPRSDPSAVGRKPDQKASEERIVLHLQRRGASIHHQRGRAAELQAGDFSLCSADEAYLVDLPTRHELLVVEFPRRLLVQRVPDIADRFARRISGASPGGRIFHDFFLSLWLHGDQGRADPEWQSGVSAVFFDLMAMAIRGSDLAPQATPGSAMRERLIALVEARLSDPDLRTATMADDLHVSPRTVQNLFAAMGTTPGGYVLERRLTRAAELLRNRSTASITGLAFDLGFNDSAYFTRCFRQRFGTTPSEWRGNH